ncbi:hypothetical protein [Azospirillum sp. 11R-A]|uniref:hypothetical protein n=1 Tax=Azospirillum sp. 11R-A TaxID=3111634 RepID=UPI003C2E1E36
MLAGGAGADTLDGDAGGDTADYRSSAAAVSVNLATGAAVGGDAAGDVLIYIEHVVDSAYNDTHRGNRRLLVMNPDRSYMTDTGLLTDC